MLWFQKLKFARSVLKMTLRDVEAKTGISNAYLSQIETGKIKDPGFFMVAKLLSLYNLTISEIFTIDDYAIQPVA